jgi:hypothetical protein
MSALGTSDPQVGMKRLLGFIEELGDGDRSRALRVDFGIGLGELLGREPSTRERDWLGERRSGYGTVVGRSAKTLERWSDRALAELRAKLRTDQFTGDLIVLAAVEGNRILGTTTIQRESGADDLATRTSTDYPNPSDQPSMPCLIYGYPRDWRPASLTLAVAFRDGTVPDRVEALVAPNFFELVYGTDRYELHSDGGMFSCRFVRPSTGRLYAIVWHSPSW